MEIRNIWGVGRNYQEHAKELGNAVPKEPLIFLKAGSCAAFEDRPIELPTFAREFNYEVEIAVQLGPRLRPSLMTLAIDFTARDCQSAAIKEGHPWTLSKSFKNACALGKWVELGDLKNLDFQLKLNGELRQKSNTRLMVFDVETLTNYVNSRFPVVPGDVIITGTPSGVGKVKAGDVLEAEIVGHLKSQWSIKGSDYE